MQLGSNNFETYARNLRRLYLADFIDQQMQKQQVELANPVMAKATDEARGEKANNRVEFAPPLGSGQN